MLDQQQFRQLEALAKTKPQKFDAKPSAVVRAIGAAAKRVLKDGSAKKPGKQGLVDAALKDPKVQKALKSLAGRIVSNMVKKTSDSRKTFKRDKTEDEPKKTPNLKSSQAQKYQEKYDKLPAAQKRNPMTLKRIFTGPIQGKKLTPLQQKLYDKWLRAAKRKKK